MLLTHLLQLVLLAAIWGASFLFLRIGVPVFGPGKLIVLRVGLGALFLLGISAWLRRPLALRGNLRHYLLIGIFNSGLPFLLFAFAAKHLNASLLSIINASTPIFGALVARLWLGTPLSRSALLGLALGFAGVLLVMGGEPATRGNEIWLAAFAALCAPLCYAIATSYTKKYAGTLPAFDQAHGSLWGGTLFVLPLALLIPARQTPDAGDWLAVSALALMCTGWAYLIFFRLIRAIGPARTLTVTFMVPVFGVLWGWLFLNESITPSMLLGGLVVLAGTALANGLLSFGRRQK